jgi:hypothetical protein
MKVNIVNLTFGLPLLSPEAFLYSGEASLRIVYIFSVSFSFLQGVNVPRNKYNGFFAFALPDGQCNPDLGIM